MLFAGVSGGLCRIRHRGLFSPIGRFSAVEVNLLATSRQITGTEEGSRRFVQSPPPLTAREGRISVFSFRYSCTRVFVSVSRLAKSMQGENREHMFALAHFLDRKRPMACFHPASLVLYEKKLCCRDCSFPPTVGLDVDSGSCVRHAMGGA